MILEIQILEPTKLNVNDCDIISRMMMNEGPEKDQRYDDLVENVFPIDEDELVTFDSFKSSIFYCSGYQIKTNLLYKMDIDCMDEMIVSQTTGIPEINMRPLCNALADRYYSCNKFYWNADEFKELIEKIDSELNNLQKSDPAIDVVNNEIILKLDPGKNFVHFLLR